MTCSSSVVAGTASSAIISIIESSCQPLYFYCSTQCSSMQCLRRRFLNDVPVVTWHWDTLHSCKKTAKSKQCSDIIRNINNFNKQVHYLHMIHIAYWLLLRNIYHQLQCIEHDMTILPICYIENKIPFHCLLCTVFYSRGWFLGSHGTWGAALNKDYRRQFLLFTINVNRLGR